MNTLTSLRTTASALENDRIYSDTLLRALNYKKNEYVLQKFGKVQKVKRNEGTNTIQWRRYKPLPVATDRHVITEGTNPDGMKIGAMTVEGSVSTYGAYIEVTRQLETYNLDKIIRIYSPLITSHAAETLEFIVRDELESGAGVSYVNDRASESELRSTDILTLKEIRKETTAMAANRRGGNETAGGKKYAVLTPIEGMQDLLNDSDLLASAMIPGNTNKPVMDNSLEEYSVYNLKFVQNPLAYVSEETGYDGTIQVYSTYILGESPYAVMDLQGAGVEFKQLGFDAKSGDNLGLTASLGWVIMGFGAKVLDQVSCVKLLHCVTDPVTREDVYAEQEEASV